MKNSKDILIAEIRDKAIIRIKELSKEFADPMTKDREAVHAGLEIERWLVDSCTEFLQH